uniref:Uncharacterized protein n=1 Tax=Arundo donax TaxID=35708 RepID=A0A0A9F5E7_ARUDO
MFIALTHGVAHYFQRTTLAAVCSNNFNA